MKIRAEVPYKIIGDVFSVFFNKDVEKVIVDLQQIMRSAKEAGYSNIAVEWSFYGDPCPTFYGDREETEKETAARIKQEAFKAKKEKDKIRKQIAGAKEILAKYGEKYKNSNEKE